MIKQKATSGGGNVTPRTEKTREVLARGVSVSKSLERWATPTHTCLMLPEVMSFDGSTRLRCLEEERKRDDEKMIRSEERYAR